jgi:hypothetical protein
VRPFHAASTYSRTLPGIFRNALTFNSSGIIQLGLLVLVAAPVLRVIFSVIAFVIERNILYTVATLIMLGVLSCTASSFKACSRTLADPGVLCRLRAMYRPGILRL